MTLINLQVVHWQSPCVKLVQSFLFEGRQLENALGSAALRRTDLSYRCAVCLFAVARVGTFGNVD